MEEGLGIIKELEDKDKDYKMLFSGHNNYNHGLTTTAIIFSRLLQDWPHQLLVIDEGRIHGSLPPTPK